MTADAIHPWLFVALLTLTPVVLITVLGMAWPRLRRWRAGWRWDRAEIAARRELIGAWVQRHYPALFIVLAIVLFWPWFSLVMTLAGNVTTAAARLALLDGTAATPAAEGQYRNIVFNLGVSMTALVATATAPFALLKAWINERSTRTTEQTQLTEQFTAAVEQLGATRERYVDGQPVTEPNIEVRLGAIYALERIAQDSARDHIAVMETLCAYVRQNTREPSIQEFPLAAWYTLKLCETPDIAKRFHESILRFGGGFHVVVGETRPNYGNILEWSGAQAAPRIDVQAILTTLGRRAPKRIVLEQRNARKLFAPLLAFFRGNDLTRYNLSGTFLRRAMLMNSDIRGLDLSNSRLEGCDFRWARMEGVNLNKAQLTGADLSAAKLQGAQINAAKLEGANLSHARLTGATLQKADLRGVRADWVRLQQAHLWSVEAQNAQLTSAQCQGADFWDARFDMANLSRANFEKATLSSACFDGANLSNATLEGAVLDKATFAMADLKGTMLTHAFAAGADLSSSLNLTEAQIENALGDAATVLPNHLKERPAHWSQETVIEGINVADHRRWLAAGCPKTADWRDHAPLYDPAKM